jgi:hypothetical protein
MKNQSEQNKPDSSSVYLLFFTRFLVLLATVFLLDLIIGSVLKKFYFQQESGLDYRSTYSIEKTTADVLIFGSSTANHDYIPEIFGKVLGMHAYNVGRDGTSVFYDYSILKMILKRYSPKIIILDFDKQEFSKDQQSYDRLTSLLPYYKDHPEIDKIVDLKSPFEKYKLLSKIYPYNSLIFTIAVGNAEFNKKREKDINGYVPLNDVWGFPIKDGSTFTNYEADSNKVRAYACFIRNCVKAKVELYVVCSPVFVKPNYVNNSVILGKEIADKYNVKFFDYSKDSSLLNRPELFFDLAHLNDEGAKVYSKMVVDGILNNRY